MLKRLKSTLLACTFNWRLLRKVTLLDLMIGFFWNIWYILFGNEKAKDRLKVCATCEYNHEEFCLMCDCHIPAKVLARGQHCPMGRWKE